MSWSVGGECGKNEKKLDEFKSEICKKYNLQFGFIAKTPQIFAPKAKASKLTALKAESSKPVPREKA